MSVSTSNVLGSVTANVVQGLANINTFTGLSVAPAVSQYGIKVNWPVVLLGEGEMLRDNIADRAFGSGFKQMSAEISLDDSTLSGAGLEMPIDSSLANDSSKRGLQILTLYSRELMLNALRYDEAKTAALAQGSGFDSANSVVAYTQANIATIDFAQDVIAALEAVAGRGETADTIVIPIDVWTRIRRSDLLKSFVVGTLGAGALVTPANLQKAFAEDGIRKVLIGRARVNTASKKNVTISPIWSTSHVWVGSTMTGFDGELEGSLGGAMSTFYSDEFSSPYFVETYYKDEIRSHVLRVYGETNKKIINARAGTRIATQWA